MEAAEVTESTREQLFKLAAPILAALLIAVLANNWWDMQRRVDGAEKAIVLLRENLSALTAVQAERNEPR